MAITILKTTQRGAHLITDGNKVAWVRPSSLRDDGTWTASAMSALANGKTVAEHEAEQAEWHKANDAKRAAREQAYQEGKLPTTINLAAGRVFAGTDKAWKVSTNAKVRLYGRWCFKYEYLPKSLVTVKQTTNGAVELTMPKWFLAKNEWLKSL